MAKPSSKKVARAARTTGGRTARGATPWGWYSVMGIVVLVGSLGVWQSREQRIDKANASGQISPKVNDHIHAALGVWVCDKFLPNIPDSGRDPLGIHTHGDGIVHIHPFTNAAAGNKAQLKIYADAVGMKLSATSFKIPGDDKTWRDGQRCDGKPGEVQLFVNGQRRSGNPASYKPNDRDLLVLAFAPRDAEDIPKTPPSAPTLDNLSDVPQASTTVPGAPPADGSAPPTTAPGTPPADAGATTTTAPPGTTAPPTSTP
jgi:hypothetical protein